jgi:hemolysin III
MTEAPENPNAESVNGEYLPTVIPHKRQHRTYSLGEEIANAVTHGIGAALSIAALAILVFVAAMWGDGWQLASAIVYGTTMIMLYLASTLYHAITNERARHVFKIIDHASIYLLIAGTYTPFTLVTIREQGGWWLFSIIWLIAIVGIAFEAAWVYRPKWVSAAVYLVMGWLAMTAIGPLWENLGEAGRWLLVGGGLAYTVGTAFYVLKRVRFMHAVWHLWVLAGSVMHFLAVMLDVITIK